MDLFVIQLAIIFVPGLIWVHLDSQYGTGTKTSDPEKVVRAFIFGMVSYAVTFVIYRCCGWTFELFDFGSASTKSILSPSSALEILFSTIVGFFLSILWLYGKNHKILTRFLQWIRATRKYGDEDVWDFTFNSRDAAVEYANIRDFEKKLTFSGWVKAFSEAGDVREIVLRDAEVFSFEGDRLYASPLIYISRSKDDITVEFPYDPEKKDG